MFERPSAMYLQRCTEGDREAMEHLLVEELPLIHQEVQRSISRFILQGEEARDVVQEAIIRILERGPVLCTPSRDDWRALLVRIVRNTVIDRYRYYKAQRRDLAEQQSYSLDGLVTVDLRAPLDRSLSPDEAAWRAEVRGLVGVALNLLPDAQRQAIELREFAQLDWSQIGSAVPGDDQEPRSAAAARMLYQRGLEQLGLILDGLEKGRISALLAAGLSHEAETRR